MVASCKIPYVKNSSACVCCCTWCVLVSFALLSNLSVWVGGLVHAAQGERANDTSKHHVQRTRQRKFLHTYLLCKKTYHLPHYFISGISFNKQMKQNITNILAGLLREQVERQIQHASRSFVSPRRHRQIFSNAPVTQEAICLVRHHTVSNKSIQNVW